jgi:dTDP-4-amino-4,6-dideoxygalactose transaminase
MVPLLDLPRMHKPVEDELERAAIDVIRSGKYILGPQVGELEQALQKYIGVKHVISCANGSDALVLALQALDLQPGDEVITTPYTFFATVSAATRLQLKPVFVDIDHASFNIDLGQLEAAITPRTRVILPVHLFGQAVNMDRLMAIANKHNLKVVEDCAQAIGSEWNNKQVGSLGDIGTFSFFPTKNLGGLGDGGALTTNDDALAERLRCLRMHGMQPKYYHKYVGLNGRLDTLQAALLLVKLPHLDTYAACRRANATMYNQLLAKAGAEVEMPTETPGAYHVYNQYVIRTGKNRDALKSHLNKLGVGCEIYYPLSLHMQECFAFLGYKQGQFPESENAAATSLALPIFGELTRKEIDEVVAGIASFH